MRVCSELYAVVETYHRKFTFYVVCSQTWEILHLLPNFERNIPDSADHDIGILIPRMSPTSWTNGISTRADPSQLRRRKKGSCSVPVLREKLPWLLQASKGRDICQRSHLPLSSAPTVHVGSVVTHKLDTVDRLRMTAQNFSQIMKKKSGGNVGKAPCLPYEPPNRERPL